VTAVVLNNKSLQIEREVMNRVYGRTAFVDFMKQSNQKPWNPDFSAIAQSMGAEALKVKTPAELTPALKKALNAGSSYVIDVEIDIHTPGYRNIWYPYPNNFWIPKDDIDKHF
jgi:thiamine pyrophosphate-dependent acetolactate synthase large subunit-like protein